MPVEKIPAGKRREREVKPLDSYQQDYIAYRRLLKGNYRKGVHTLRSIFLSEDQAKLFAANSAAVSVVIDFDPKTPDLNATQLYELLRGSSVLDDALFTYFSFEGVEDMTLNKTHMTKAMASSTNALDLIASSKAIVNAMTASPVAVEALWRSENALTVFKARKSAWTVVNDPSSEAIGKVVCGLAGVDSSGYPNMDAVAASDAAMQAIVDSPLAAEAMVSSGVAMKAVAASSGAMKKVISSEQTMVMIGQDKRALSSVEADEKGYAVFVTAEPDVYAKTVIGSVGLDPADYPDMASVRESSDAIVKIYQDASAIKRFKDNKQAFDLFTDASQSSASIGTAAATLAGLAVKDNGTVEAICGSTSSISTLFESRAATTALMDSRAAMKIAVTYDNFSNYLKSWQTPLDVLVATPVALDAYVGYSNYLYRLADYSTSAQTIAASRLAMETFAESATIMQMFSGYSTISNAIANSETAMDIVASSETAMKGMIYQSTGCTYLVSSTVAMRAIVASESASKIMAASDSMMRYVSNNATAARIIADSEIAMKNVAESSTALSRVFSGTTTAQAMVLSTIAMNAIMTSDSALIKVVDYYYFWYSVLHYAVSADVKAALLLKVNGDPACIKKAYSRISGSFSSFGSKNSDDAAALSTFLASQTYGVLLCALGRADEAASTAGKMNILCNGVKVASSGDLVKPTSVGSSNCNAIAIAGCTFAEENDGYAAVYGYYC